MNPANFVPGASASKAAESPTACRSSDYVALKVNSYAEVTANANSKVYVSRLNPVEASIPSQVTQNSTCASLVDLDDGSALNSIPAQSINGNKCAHLVHEDVQAEIEYWNTAVLCAVLGANPPLDVIKGYINRIWGAYELDKIIQLRRGLFMVRFQHLQDKMEVERKDIFYFDSKPFIVKSWNPEMDLRTESIKSLPLWVQLPDLDIKYRGLRSLSKIGSLIGNPLKTDKYTADKSRLSYARLLIDVPLDGSFPESVEFFNEKDVLIRQPVKFEWLRTKCSFCGMFGHLEQVCRKKSAPKKAWRRVEQGQDTGVSNPPIQRQQNSATVLPNPYQKDCTQNKGIAASPNQDTSVFIPVTRKSAARMGSQQSIPHTMAYNSFHLLQSGTESPNQVEQVPGTISND